MNEADTKKAQEIGDAHGRVHAEGDERRHGMRLRQRLARHGGLGSGRLGHGGLGSGSGFGRHGGLGSGWLGGGWFGSGGLGSGRLGSDQVVA